MRDLDGDLRFFKVRSGRAETSCVVFLKRVFSHLSVPFLRESAWHAGPNGRFLGPPLDSQVFVFGPFSVSGRAFGPDLGGVSRVPLFFGAQTRFGFRVPRSSRLALFRAAFFANHHLKPGPERKGFALGAAFWNFGFGLFLGPRRAFGSDLGGDSCVVRFSGLLAAWSSRAFKTSLSRPSGAGFRRICLARWDDSTPPGGHEWIFWFFLEACF